MLLCFALIMIQLVNIQFRRAPALASSPLNPASTAKHFNNFRGSIYASNGALLAYSVKAKSGPYEYQRVYPYGSLYSGIVGYDSIFYGTSGIEYEYNKQLTVHNHPPQTLSQVLLGQRPPPTADDVILTVDPYLQNVAENALTTLPPGKNKDGAVVVLDPATGAVLAMVSTPNFNPNPLASPNIATEEKAHYIDSLPDHEGFSPLVPMAIGDSFPPGSTFKVVTSTAVYNLKPSLANFNFPPEVGLSFPDSNKILYNYGHVACGGTLAQMLPPSCDPGYGELGIQLGPSIMYKQANLFGFNSIPGIDIPGAVPSVFPSPAQVGVGNLPFQAYDAIGQYNVRATALQAAMTAATIANGGITMTPHLMAQIRGAQGNVVETYTPKPLPRTASASAAAQVSSLMQLVPKVPDGTAYGTISLNLNAAVKTGTSQVQAPGVTPQTDDWMIGFAPATGGTPKIAIAVVLPSQAGYGTGAGMAGPIVNTIMEAALHEPPVGSAGNPSPVGSANNSSPLK